MRKSLGFTLAEVLITLAIIGVVAAMTIPSVIVNTNQQEFKTGLKKAVSVLNQAITMNIALENISPADTNSADFVQTSQYNLLGYLAQRLNVIKVTTMSKGAGNAAFYTSDGMRFEIPATPGGQGLSQDNTNCGDGIKWNADNSEQPKPCLILVDVNGDKKPNPPSGTENNYTTVPANSTKINDIFSIMITDLSAIPYGTVAQRTMFQND